MPASRLHALLPLVLALLVGCHASPPSGTSATGAIQLAVDMPTAAPADVSRVTVTVSGADMTPRSTDLAPTNGAWGGVLSELPAGTGRAFQAQAFSATNVLRYEGRVEDVTITAGSTGLVTLTLQDVSAPPPFSNEAPFIDSLVASATTVAPGGTVSLTASAHDPNAGDGVSYAWTAPSGIFSTPSQSSTSWTAPSRQGPVSLSLTVSDSRGAALTMSLSLTVSAGSGADEVKVGFNAAPRVGALTSSQSLLDVGQQTALSVSATDADGDALGYQWSATCAGTFTGATSASATFTPSALPTAACNNCSLTVTVTDGRGGQTTGSLALCVSKDPRRAPPLVTRSFQSSLTAQAGQSLTFEVGASDPAGSALTFAWTATTGTLATATSGASSSRVVWTAPTACVPSGTTPGPTATVTNASGLTATKSFTVTGLTTCTPASWTQTGAMVVGHGSHTATLLSNGKLLVVGGPSDYIPSTAELYDPATGRWSTTGSFTGKRVFHTATLLPDGKVLITGGLYDSTYLTTAELYNPATGTWSATSSMTSARIYHTATLLSNGKVLVAGGSTGWGDTTTAELYDPATGTWSAASTMAYTHSMHTATQLLDGRVLVAGGYSRSEVYDPATGKWSITGSTSDSRSHHTATLLPDGRVLVSGGYNGKYVATAELYNPATGTWSAAGALSLSRYGHTATLLPSGKVLVSGGGNSTSGYLATAELYDPATGTWSPTVPMSASRQWHTATLLPSGKVLVSGGRNDSYLTTTELYTPAASP